MKDTSREILAAAIGIAAGSALGILLAKNKTGPAARRMEDSACKSRKREKLLFVKGKMEMHRERLDRHLNRINAKIESLGAAVHAGDAKKEHGLLKPDPALI
jgi:hypothetical protein